MKADLIHYFIATMHSPLVLGGLFVLFSVLLLIRYLLINYWCYRWAERLTNQRPELKIQARKASPEQVKNEIKMGIVANLVMALNGVFTHYLIFAGHTKLYYHSWDERGVGYFFFSLIAIILIYDAWFYWIHYLLHENKFMFKHVHSWHHRFKNPTAFADLALHPIEALLYVIIIPALLMLMPLHYYALGFLYLCLVVANIFGHVGVEIFPTKWRTHPVWGKFNYMGFHNFHHSHVRGNYGFAFKFWDILMKTQLPEYMNWLKRR